MTRLKRTSAATRHTARMQATTVTTARERFLEDFMAEPPVLFIRNTIQSLKIVQADFEFFIIYLQAATKASKIPCMAGSAALSHSGCHCTPKQNFASGFSMPSTMPSSLRADSTRPGATLSTA